LQRSTTDIVGAKISRVVDVYLHSSVSMLPSASRDLVTGLTHFHTSYTKCIRIDLQKQKTGHRPSHRPVRSTGE